MYWQFSAVYLLCDSFVFPQVEWRVLLIVFLSTQKTYFSDFEHKFVKICLRELFPPAKIIHLRDRCGLSRCWLNSVIIAQVRFTEVTTKCDLSNMYVLIKCVSVKKIVSPRCHSTKLFTVHFKIVVTSLPQRLHILPLLTFLTTN